MNSLSSFFRFTLSSMFLMMIVFFITGFSGMQAQSSCSTAHTEFTRIGDTHEITTWTNDGYYTPKYEWSFKGQKWTWEQNIPAGLYNYYRGLSRTYNDYTKYATGTRDREIIRGLISSFKNAARDSHWSDYKTLEFIISFVQSLEYMSDETTTGQVEYPRYPVETLVDKGGDCEDTAILLASILLEMGYNVAFIHLPGHVAVGIAGLKDICGSYYDYNGKKYYYIETTNPGWKIGQVPKEYLKQSAELYLLKKTNSNRQTGYVSKAVVDYKYGIYFLAKDVNYNYYNIDITLENKGTAKADNLELTVYVQDEWGNDTWEVQKVKVGGLTSGAEISNRVIVRVPKHKKATLQILIEGTNTSSIRLKSPSFN